MAKELLEILARQEQLAQQENDERKLGYAIALKGLIYEGLKSESIYPTLPTVSAENTCTNLNIDEVVLQNFRYSFKSSLLEFDQQIITLTPIENRLLCCLFENLDQTIPNADIELAVWGENIYVGTTNRLEVHIHRLRSKLSSHSSPVKIVTYHRIGYKLEVITD